MTFSKSCTCQQENASRISFRKKPKNYDIYILFSKYYKERGVYFALESHAAVLSDEMTPQLVSFNIETSRRKVLLILEENLDLIPYLHIFQDK